MATPTRLPTFGSGPGSAGSPSPSPSHLDRQDEQKGQEPGEQVANRCPLSAPLSALVPLQRPVATSSSMGPFIHALGSPRTSPAHSPLPPRHGPPRPPPDNNAAIGTRVSTSRPASRLPTSASTSANFVGMTARALDHSRRVPAAGLDKNLGNQQDLALLHVDRTLARLSRLLATVVESHEAQSMLQPLLRRNILLAQFSLAVLKSAPAGPAQPTSAQRRRQQSHHPHHPNPAFLATQPLHIAQARPELQRAHLSAPAILLTAPSRKSDTGNQSDAANTEEQNGNPDEFRNLAEDLAAIASLLCDLANPRHITVSLDCPNVILPFRGPHLLSSRHLILVAGYCLGIIADHGHLAISLHWPTGWSAETTMHMGEQQSPVHPPGTGLGASATTDGKQGVNIGSFAGTQEMDAKSQHPIVCIRASPMLPHYQQHVPTVADLPTPFVSSVRMRCRVNQPGSKHPPPGTAPAIPQATPPTARRTSSTAPIPTSSPSPPGSPDWAQTSPIGIPSTVQDPLITGNTQDFIVRPTSQTPSLESSDLTTASTTTSDLHCSLTIEIQLPLTSVPRSVGAQPHSLYNPAVVIHSLDDPPTPASPMFRTGTHSAPHTPTLTQPADHATTIETRTDILESFASSLNGHPIGCFPSATVLHSLRALGVIPHPMRNVSHFPRMSVVHLPSHLLKRLVTALRKLPRQEPIGVLAILDSDDQVVDVFEWLEANAATSAEPPLDRDRQHTHLDRWHNLVLHIAPNPPCTLLLLESLIVLNATLHLVRGVGGATSAGGVTGAKPAMDGARTAAAAKSGAAGQASATTSSVRHWGSPAPPEAASPMGLLSPTDPAIVEWERTMDMLAETCGVVGGEVDEGSMNSASVGQVKEVPAPPVAPKSVSSSSVAAGPSSRVMSPLPQYPATSPPTPTPTPVHQYSAVNLAHHACAAMSPPVAAAPMHRRITLSNIPDSIAALGSKLLSPYVPVADMRLFPLSPAAAAFADTPAYSFTSDAQRLWSPLVPMRSLTMVPPGMYQGRGAGELQLPSVAAGLRPPPPALVPLDARVGLSGMGRRQSLLRRKSDESLRGLFPLVRVLVVEDDPIATRILSIFLARRSIDHITATTGPQAMHHFTRSGPFHVVLMNLGLAQQPGKDAMDGLECTRAMRQFELERGGGGGARGILPPAVIIALTADTSDDTHRAALVAGCNDVAVKPFRLRWIEDKLIEVAALMGLVQPAMEMRELASAGVGDQGRDEGGREDSEEQRTRRERAWTWAQQVKRDVAAPAGVGAGEQLSHVFQPAFPRRRSVSADAQISGGQADVRDDELWDGTQTAEGRAARARTSSYLGPLPVSVAEDKPQQVPAVATGDEVGSFASTSLVPMEE